MYLFQITVQYKSLEGEIFGEIIGQKLANNIMANIQKFQNC